MKKICIVTATRAEYGLLKWLMKEVDESDELSLQLVVTGAHLLKEQGHTIDLIKNDGFTIDEEVDVRLDSSSPETIAESMGKMACMFSHTFTRLQPDYLIVLGDRYELLPIVNTAFVMRIPIIHLSGGDVTGGAIDDGIRNAVTMLSDYHFPGTYDSGENIIRMTGRDDNVWVVGEPGLDSFYRETLSDRNELARILNIDVKRKWVLFTYHAETRKSLEYNLDAVRKVMNLLLDEDDIQIVATYANTDYGGKYINEYLEATARDSHNKLRVIPSLGNKNYLSFMKQVVYVIGNSSSGIVEAPVLGIPVVNIGDRQKGRYQCKNIIQTDVEEVSIREAIKTASLMDKGVGDFYWGDGHTAERITAILKKEIG